MQAGKLTALQHIQRLRTGFAASDYRPHHTPALIACSDLVDVTLSRNLLAHLRRVAEATAGRLPTVLPLYNKDEPVEPGADVVANNHAYLCALYHHLQRHFDGELLSAHYQAVGLCIEQILRQREATVQQGVSQAITLMNQAVDYGRQLAEQQQDQANAVRWASSAQAQHSQSADQTATAAQIARLLANWRPTPERPYSFTDHWQGITDSGAVIWQGCGLRWQNGVLVVEPSWPETWSWWALLDLPLAQGKLSLVWDGAILHSTLPIQSRCPVAVQQSIRARNTDETEFDLHFEFQTEHDGVKERKQFKPQFNVSAA